MWTDVHAVTKFGPYLTSGSHDIYRQSCLYDHFLMYRLLRYWSSNISIAPRSPFDVEVGKDKSRRGFV